jgi:hypothetical protein
VSAENPRKLPRRDLCHLAGKRALKLESHETDAAWRALATELERMGDMDLPKFKHLYAAIRKATIQARRP